jgi:hypothetical protein
MCKFCSRDGNLFLTLVLKIYQSGSMIFISGDCTGQGRCWSSRVCSSNHDGIVPAVWMGALSSWKTIILFGNNVWIMLHYGMHLITQPIHVFPCSNSAMKLNNGTNTIPRYCSPNHHKTSPMFHCWNQAFRIIDFFGCSPNVSKFSLM